MSIHAIKRAKERYGVDFTFDDINAIIKKIIEGEAKEITYEGLFPFPKNQKLYHLRYNGLLIKPAVKNLLSNPTITTFLPAGKRVSNKKYFLSKCDPDYTEKIKRFKIEK